MVIQTFNKEGQCRRCGKGMMMTDDTTGERFCNSCGLVVVERIDDSGPERHMFSKDERDDKTRTGAPTSLAMHDMGLATIIGHTNKDATGKPLSSSMNQRPGTWASKRRWAVRYGGREPLTRLSVSFAMSLPSRLTNRCGRCSIFSTRAVTTSCCGWIIKWPQPKRLKT